MTTTTTTTTFTFTFTTTIATTTTTYQEEEAKPAQSRAEQIAAMKKAKEDKEKADKANKKKDRTQIVWEVKPWEADQGRERTVQHNTVEGGGGGVVYDTRSLEAERVFIA